KSPAFLLTFLVITSFLLLLLSSPLLLSHFPPFLLNSSLPRCFLLRSSHSHSFLPFTSQSFSSTHLASPASIPSCAPSMHLPILHDDKFYFGASSQQPSFPRLRCPSVEFPVHIGELL